MKADIKIAMCISATGGMISSMATVYTFSASANASKVSSLMVRKVEEERKLFTLKSLLSS